MKKGLILGILFSMTLYAETLLVPITDPVLHQRSDEVAIEEISKPEIQELIASMLKLSHNKLDEKDAGTFVGLAAPQIGHNKRIIIVDVAAQDSTEKTPDLRVFINPEIVWTSETVSESYEGCYSTGPLIGIVPRSQHVRVEAYNRHGQKETLEVSQLIACIFQHEIDHLNGVLIGDRVSDEDHLHIVLSGDLPKYRECFKNHQPWDRTCSQSLWEHFKTNGFGAIDLNL